MKRIIVIGCPGSGKSTFSRMLGKALGIDVCHLDNLYWNADKTIVEKSVFLTRLSSAMEKDALIIDGNFSSTLDMRLNWCDTVFFLDLPSEVCLESVRKRIGTPRPDIPWTETETDAEFMAFIESFGEARRPHILELLKKYKKETVIFTSRNEVDSYIERLK